MDSTTTTTSNACQLQSLCEGTTRLGLKEKFRQMILRLLTAAERRIDHYRGRLSPTIPSESPMEWTRAEVVLERANISTDSDTPLLPGQWVEVLSFEVIAATLDEKGTCDRLEFMEGMRAFCGKRLRVRKQVRMMFDERSWRMLKIKRPRYLLDESICDGKGMYDKEGCDRCCYYFWTDRWLRRC